MPQSGPITRTPCSAAYVLSATSSATGTLSLKIITSWPASIASIASTVALAPGTDTSTTAPGAVRRRAEDVVRGGATSLDPALGRTGASAASTAARAPDTSASSSSRSATTMSLGEESGTAKPMPSSTSRLRPVAIATCAVTTPGAACTVRLTWSRVTESA